METAFQTSLLFLSQKKETNFPRLVYQSIKNIILKFLKKSGESQMVKEILLKIYSPFYQACIVLSLQITVLVLRLRIKTTLYLQETVIFGYPISFGVNFRVNLGVDFWGLLNDLFFFCFSFLYTLCVVFFLIIFRRFIQS